MRGIEKTTQFKKDYKREKKGKYREVLETLFVEVLVALANDNELAEKHRDHALTNKLLLIGIVPDRPFSLHTFRPN